jgi:CheY-like chemotaxis protein
MSREELVVLLVEDDEGHASLVQRNLKRSGIANEIVHVRDGQDAIDFLWRQGAYSSRNKEGPLLLLLDINMPRVDGIEVLRRVKSDETMSKIPVIMLTTTDDPREVKRCYELGCSIYVTKPVAYDDFVEAVKRLGLFLAIVEAPREDERT